MFEYIYKWLENLSGYMLLTAVVTQILPGGEYRKYMRFYCGLVLIIMLVSPLFQLFGMKADFEQLYADMEYQRIIKELEEASEQIVEFEQELE